MATEKVSITLDSQLLAEIRRRSANVSALVNEALDAYFRNARLGELLDELDREFGPVPAEVREQARHDWMAAMDQIQHARRGGDDAGSADP
jgi:post-segregation antitoxin CcdA